MWLQVLLIFFAFILFLRYKTIGDSVYTRHNYITWLIALLIIQSGLRHFAIGDDTFAYFRFFEELKKESWEEVFHHFYEVYVLKIGKDAGFQLLEKVFQVFCPDFQLFLIAVAAAFFIPFYRMVERYLPSLRMVFMSFCIYQALFYSFFSITGIRQVVAAIATIIGVKFIEERKLLNFFIVIILASFIHKSVLIFLPFYFLANFKKSNLVLICSLCSLPVIFPFARGISRMMVSISGSDVYTMYSESDYETSGAQNFVILMVFSTICLIIAKWKNPGRIPNLVVNAMSLALIFTPLTWVDPSLMRVVQYFSIFLVIGLPLALDNIGMDKFMFKLTYLGITSLLLYTIIRRSYEYAFFWENMKLPPTFPF